MKKQEHFPKTEFTVEWALEAETWEEFVGRAHLLTPEQRNDSRLLARAAARADELAPQ